MILFLSWWIPQLSLTDIQCVSVIAFSMWEFLPRQIIMNSIVVYRHRTWFGNATPANRGRLIGLKMGSHVYMHEALSPDNVSLVFIYIYFASLVSLSFDRETKWVVFSRIPRREKSCLIVSLTRGANNRNSAWMKKKLSTVRSKREDGSALELRSKPGPWGETDFENRDISKFYSPAIRTLEDD